MKSRLNIQKLEPKAYEAMYGLENFLANSELDKLHLELIKIRASQINGCAFCINMHTKDAMKLGETNQRIFLLNAWRETTLFTEEERVILAMTEEITNISQHGLSEETYQKALSLFSENYIAIIIIAITTINAWNRIAISSHMMV
ncbi:MULTISPECIES: carboxymuconolactone decarboxylase family protein [Empedobacter]|uniref:Carboxymuconolactone decarboxylase family protein n=2 Tax=Empedobacter TaxID=59734 RepID=A0AAW7DLE9_9FLAO|nr:MULTISPECIES: carboxymuconolactone decarboxylase family protein [Empedobacter]MDM1547302.1 carboxymuconolactone decarboxylase family protein [Empedobacter falsenii]MDM1551086.1 carboxymuconolactone decarboxylase family protein [Empedobacter falsenii]TGN27988.1 carboxymuconolactone decarboxylase family protein [Empedobacter tilapiae]